MIEKYQLKNYMFHELFINKKYNEKRSWTSAVVFPIFNGFKIMSSLTSDLSWKERYIIVSNFPVFLIPILNHIFFILLKFSSRIVVSKKIREDLCKRILIQLRESELHDKNRNKFSEEEIAIVVHDNAKHFIGELENVIGVFEKDLKKNLESQLNLPHTYSVLNHAIALCASPNLEKIQKEHRLNKEKENNLELTIEKNQSYSFSNFVSEFIKPTDGCFKKLLKISILSIPIFNIIYLLFSYTSNVFKRSFNMLIDTDDLINSRSKTRERRIKYGKAVKLLMEELRVVQLQYVQTLQLLINGKWAID